MRAMTIVAAAVALIGCARTETLNTQFNPQEAAYINQKGDGSIQGQAFMKTVGGEVRYAAGNTVLLIPDTAYARERFQKLYGDSKCNYGAVRFDKDPDPAYLKMARSTKANGEGRFRFDGLAPGAYFVATQLVWGVPTQYGLQTAGCNIYEKALVQHGAATEVIMTGS